MNFPGVNRNPQRNSDRGGRIMANANLTQSDQDDSHQVKRRLLAVLDYDGIPECGRIKHLMNKCNISRYMAKRALNGILPRYARVADGLDVCFIWLLSGEFWKFHPRTARIQMMIIEGESAAEAESLIGSIASEVPGEPTYACFGGSYPNSRKFTLMDIVMLEQRRRMTKWEQNKHLRLMLRLLNSDPKARRLCDMVGKGQITRQQMFSMV